MNNPSRFTLSLQSDLDEIVKLEPFGDTLKKNLACTTQRFSEIQLALNEAVTNAIKHGNKQDEHKCVEIEATVTEKELLLMVKDEGDGFDPSALPDPLQAENLLKESGRGVFLIKSYADEVEFKGNGNTLIMRFTL